MIEKPHTWELTSEEELGALEVSKSLQKKGFTVYWAGGCVRDSLLGLKPKDIDIATNASVEEIQDVFPKNIPVGKEFGVIIVPHKEINYEIATFRSDGTYSDGRHPDKITQSTPEEDATRRDFTINALFWDPFQMVIIDYVDGLIDLEKKIIRSVGDPERRFAEDKLRILRGVRFSVEFDFPLEQKTRETITSMANEITVVSQERIRDELIKMFTGRSPKEAVELMSETGLLNIILPEIETFKGVEQPPEYHPEGDVWVHVMLMLSFCKHSPLELVLGILFHDIAKPATFERAADRIRFTKHQSIGTRMTKQILTRLKFSNKIIQLTQDLVAQHMKFGDAPKMRPGKLKNFVLQENFDTHLELHRIDCMGSHEMLGSYKLCLKIIEEIKQQPEIVKPLISGKDLIQWGLKPGPRFKELLEVLREAQLEGTVKTKPEALEYLKGKFSDILE